MHSFLMRKAFFRLLAEGCFMIDHVSISAPVSDHGELSSDSLVLDPPSAGAAVWFQHSSQ